MEILYIKNRNSTEFGFSGDTARNEAAPAIPFKDLLPNMEDLDMISVSFQYSPLIYFSNRESNNEKFSTSMLFAGFTESDKVYSTQALKNSFFIFDIFSGDERTGYIFSKIVYGNFVSGFDEPYNIKGIALVSKGAYNTSRLYDAKVSLRFFNGRRGGISNFNTVEGKSYYDAKISMNQRNITLTQSNPIFFESWNPYLESLQGNSQGATPTAPNTPSNGIVLPSGKIIQVRQLVCNDDFADSENC